MKFLIFKIYKFIILCLVSWMNYFFPAFWAYHCTKEKSIFCYLCFLHF